MLHWRIYTIFYLLYLGKIFALLEKNQALFDVNGNWQRAILIGFIGPVIEKGIGHKDEHDQAEVGRLVNPCIFTARQIPDGDVLWEVYRRRIFFQ